MFADIEEAYYNCQQCTKQFKEKDSFDSHTKCCHEQEGTRAQKKLKVRFKEVMDERPNNEKLISLTNQIDMEEVNYAEIKENKENFEKVKKAKEKELSNFDDYKAFEEVQEDGQDILGTRFVLTEKPDGTIKPGL